MSHVTSVFRSCFNDTDNDCINLGGTARTLYDSLSNFGMSFSGIYTKLTPLIARQRSFHLHGQANARLDKSQDAFSHVVYDNSNLLVSAAAFIISPLFFFAPDTHLQKLGQYLNELVYYPTWTSYLDTLQTDWQQSMLFVSVRTRFLS